MTDNSIACAHLLQGCQTSILVTDFMKNKVEPEKHDICTPVILSDDEKGDKVTTSNST